MRGWNMVILELSPRERIIRDQNIYYCALCSVNHFAGVQCAWRVGEMDDLNLNKRPGPSEICATCEALVTRLLLWPPRSGRCQSLPASDSLDQSEPLAEGRPIRGCEIKDRKQILTDRVSHNKAKSSPVYTQKTAENTCGMENFTLSLWWERLFSGKDRRVKAYRVPMATFNRL